MWPGSIQTKRRLAESAGFDYRNLHTASNAEIAPSLGRNLSPAPGSNVSVPLIEPYSRYEERINQLDVRVAKSIRVGGARVQGMLDIYNVLNGQLHSCHQHHVRFGMAAPTGRSSVPVCSSSVCR